MSGYLIDNLSFFLFLYVSQLQTDSYIHQKPNNYMNDSTTQPEYQSEFEQIMSILDGTTKVDSSNYSMINRVLLCFDVGKLSKFAQ